MHHKLYVARKEARMTQRKLAEHLNIADTTYSQKESGKYDFTISEALKICEVLNCTLNDLFYEEKTEKN